MTVRLPDYEVKRILGSGSFGYVFDAFDHYTKTRVALKRIEKVGKTLSREYEILFDLKECPHVVKMLDFYYSRNHQNKLIQNIVFEYMEDNLENMIQKKIELNTSFSEAHVKLMIFQIFKGLTYIHSKNIVHRDLKPENILCKNNVIVKICDFGSSKYIDLTGKNTPYIVSRYYRAPELMFCITKYGPPIDIWATGCILAELITRQPIFQGKTESDQIGSIFTNIGTPTESDYLELAKLVPFDPNLFREFPVIPRYLVMQQLDEMFRSVHDRKNLIDLLLKCFAYVPEQRITAADAMNHKFFDSIRQEYKDLSL